ncbi:MAG: hypothetical protein ACO1RX_22660 [Candidatus Sericytochromatia bacterium]
MSPSISGMPPTGPIQMPQQVQRAPQAAKTEAPPPPKEDIPAAAQDENKTQNFDDTPISDVNAFPFEASPTEASEATAEIEGLFEAEETGEAEEVEESEEAEAPEGEGEVEEAEASEAGEVEEGEEEAEGEGDYEDPESETPEFEKVQIDLRPLLEMVPDIRELTRFRVEETWMLFAGNK